MFRRRCRALASIGSWKKRSTQFRACIRRCRASSRSRFDVGGVTGPRANARNEIGAFVKRLREDSYDAIIDTQGLLKSALVTRAARGKRFGLDWRSSREPLALFYDRTFAVLVAHAVERNRMLAARGLSYAVANSDVRDPRPTCRNSPGCRSLTPCSCTRPVHAGSCGRSERGSRSALRSRNAASRRCSPGAVPPSANVASDWPPRLPAPWFVRDSRCAICRACSRGARWYDRSGHGPDPPRWRAWRADCRHLQRDRTGTHGTVWMRPRCERRRWARGPTVDEVIRALEGVL